MDQKSTEEPINQEMPTTPPGVKEMMELQARLQPAIQASYHFSALVVGQHFIVRSASRIGE